MTSTLFNLVEYQRQQNVDQNGWANAHNRGNGEDQTNDHSVNACPIGKASANAENFLIGFIKC